MARAPSAEHEWRKGRLVKGWSKELKEDEELLSGEEGEADDMGGLFGGVPNPIKYNFFYTSKASETVGLRQKLTETAGELKELMVKKMEAEAKQAEDRRAELELLRQAFVGRGAAAAASSAAPAPSASVRLKELKQLLDDGLVTPDEFEFKRKALVDAL